MSVLASDSVFIRSSIIESMVYAHMEENQIKEVTEFLIKHTSCPKERSTH